jgi:hypothetical protein
MRKFLRVKREGWGEVKPGIGHDTGYEVGGPKRQLGAVELLKSKG